MAMYLKPILLISFLYRVKKKYSLFANVKKGAFAGDYGGKKEDFRASE